MGSQGPEPGEMAFSSVTVVNNANRLRAFKPRLGGKV